MILLTDPDIRPALKWNLAQEFASSPTIIVDELPICWGDTRIDVAVVNGSLHGYEIKSDRDSVDRLPRQVELYSKIFDTVTLVCSQRLLTKAKEIIPDWWGIQIPVVDDCAPEGVSFIAERPVEYNDTVDIRSVVELTWKEEAIAILEQYGLARGLRHRPRWDMWDRMIEAINADDLKRAVRECLKEREGWRTPETLQRLYAD
ncbi:MAG: sce7726 family protein [Armatimonadota bacterium]